MLTGRFGGTTGRPYIEGRLFLPRLGIDGNISFLLDTGADSSILMPGDALRLKVPYDQLTGDSPAVGLGERFIVTKKMPLSLFPIPAELSTPTNLI